MRIDDAIESLQLENKYPWNTKNSILRNAIKLGIEALKRVVEIRRGTLDYDAELLPGETEE